MTKRRRRLFTAILVFGAALGAVAVFRLSPALSDRTRPPDSVRGAAEESFRRAREAESDRYAAEEYERAGALLAEGLTEFREQELRLLPFRDFGSAESLLAASAEASEGARNRAGSLRLDRKRGARADLDRAAGLVRATSAFAETMHLVSADRALLRECRDGLARARLAWEEDDWEETSRLARSASDVAVALGERCEKRADRYADPSLLRKWRDDERDAVEWSRKTGKTAIVVVKASHRLTLYRAGKPVKTCAADIGFNNTADKARAGDGATPEGKYTVSQMKGRGESRYYKALLVDYPNPEDRMRFQEARRAGRLESGATPGGLIEIHGDGGRGTDWTNGCVALANDDMDEVFAAAVVGTPVTIIGSDGSNNRFAPLVERFRSAKEDRR